MSLDNFPIVNKVAQSKTEIQLTTTEQTLFAISCVLVTAREKALSLRDKMMIQDLINECCKALDFYNPGFLKSLEELQQTKKQHNRQIGRNFKNRKPSNRKPKFR